MSLDILIYAVIAVVIFSRLWSVLGTRNDNDTERPNPFITPATPPAAKNDDENFTGESTGAALPPPRQLPQFRAAPASIAGGLEQIKELDPSFDERQFLQGARAAFASIIEDYAKGDLGNISSLLGPQVLPKFQGAIEARRAAGQTAETKVESIGDADVIAASVEGKHAKLSVRFVSNQMNSLRDSSGKEIGGTEGKLEEVTDTWVFARDTGSPDPNWQLVETRS